MKSLNQNEAILRELNKFQKNVENHIKTIDNSGLEIWYNQLTQLITRTDDTATAYSVIEIFKHIAANDPVPVRRIVTIHTLADALMHNYDLLDNTSVRSSIKDMIKEIEPFKLIPKETIKTLRNNLGSVGGQWYSKSQETRLLMASTLANKTVVFKNLKTKNSHMTHLRVAN